MKIKETKLYYILSVIKAGIYYYYYYYRNKKVSYFNYKQLAKNYPISSLSRNPGVIGNKCYGNLWAVKKGLSSKFNRNCIIEHGLYFGEYVLLDDLKIKKPEVIYTYGNYRKNVLENCIHEFLTNVRIETIGPYINYVENFNNSKVLEKIKLKYGKILLVFPTHSSPEVTLNYNEKDFFEKIQEVSKDYDHVFVSLFWLDIIKGKQLLYEKQGYTVVTAGTRNDPRFLNRLKDLIHLSDMTMSNDIGTHIGYCVALNKPHFYFYQKIDVNIIQPIFFQSSKDVRLIIFEREKKMFSEVFSNQNQILTKEQKDFVEYYWGKNIYS